MEASLQRKREIEEIVCGFTTVLSNDDTIVFKSWLKNVSMKELTRIELDTIIRSSTWVNLGYLPKISPKMRQLLYEWISIEDPCFCSGNRFQNFLQQDYNNWRLKQEDFKDIASVYKTRVGMSRIARETVYEDLVRSLWIVLESYKQPTLLYSIQGTLAKREKINCVKFVEQLIADKKESIVLPKKSDVDQFIILQQFYYWIGKHIPEFRHETQKGGYLAAGFFEWFNGTDQLAPKTKK